MTDLSQPTRHNARDGSSLKTPLTNSTEAEALDRLRLKVERLNYLPDSATVHVLIGDLRKLYRMIEEGKA